MQNRSKATKCPNYDTTPASRRVYTLLLVSFFWCPKTLFHALFKFKACKDIKASVDD